MSNLPTQEALAAFLKDEDRLNYARRCLAYQDAQSFRDYTLRELMELALDGLPPIAKFTADDTASELLNRLEFVEEECDEEDGPELDVSTPEAVYAWVLKELGK